MSNSMKNQFRLGQERKITDLFARVTFGASGAPTLDKVNSKGFASITRSAAGAYIVKLNETYNRVLDVNSTWVNNLGTAPAAPLVFIGNQQVTVVGSSQFSLYTAASGGALTDPASGDELKFSISLKDTSV